MSRLASWMPSAAPRLITGGRRLAGDGDEHEMRGMGGRAVAAWKRSTWSDNVGLVASRSTMHYLSSRRVNASASHIC